MAESGSDILLIEDAVYAAVAGSLMESKIKNALAQNQIHALIPDLQCRGIEVSALIEGIQTVEYEGFVELVVQNRNVHSWL